MQISQPTVSRIIFHVSCLLASLILDYIRVPRDTEACKENHRLFNDLGKRNGGIGLRGIDGAIDCTHIRLAPSKFQNIGEIFRNRKGYFSLNVQVGLYSFCYFIIEILCLIDYAIEYHSFFLFIVLIMIFVAGCGWSKDGIFRCRTRMARQCTRQPHIPELGNIYAILGTTIVWHACWW